MRIFLPLLLSLMVASFSCRAAEQGRDQASLDKQLLEAAYKGDESKIADLIARGANVNAVEHDIIQRSALHLAAMNWHGPVIQQLFEHGANIGATSLTGQTPLNFCAERNVDLIQQLEILAKKSSAIRMTLACSLHPRMGANCRLGEVVTPAFVCNVFSHFKQGALMHDEEVMQACARQVALNNAFLEAAEHCDVDSVWSLLEKGADVNATNYRSNNAIMIALSGAREKPRARGWFPVVRFLLNAGIHYKARNYDGHTIISCAKEVRNYEAKAFLEAWINARKRLPFCMAMHPRAGANSVAHQWLSQDMFRKICSYL